MRFIRKRKFFLPTAAACCGLFLAGGCAVGIKRYGYDMKDLSDTPAPPDCRIAVKEKASVEESEVELLGRAKVYDKLSWKCDEAYVFDRLIKEACALKANIITVADEKHPSFWSDCYRAKVQFLRLKDASRASELKSDPKFTRKLILKRARRTGIQRRRAAEAGALGGIMGGILAAP